MEIFLVYLLIINIITFMFFAIDKWKAMHNRWRIPEATLLGLGVVGGSIGGLIAMYTIRHKTKTLKFVIGMPLILVIQIAVIIYLYL